jgi:long-chain acyl-CoA synthetase
MNVAEWLAATARLRPEAPALLRGFDLEADYATFARRAAAVGAVLTRDYGIKAGDRVALFASNCTQYLECLYGVWWIGATAIPINAKLHGREAAWICSDAGAKLTFVSDDTIEALAEAASDLPASMKTLSMDSSAYRSMRSGEGAPTPLAQETDDLAWLFYTSGTTGRPKGVMLSHGNLVSTRRHRTMCRSMPRRSRTAPVSIISRTSASAGGMSFQNPADLIPTKCSISAGSSAMS